MWVFFVLFCFVPSYHRYVFVLSLVFCLAVGYFWQSYFTFPNSTGDLLQFSLFKRETIDLVLQHHSTVITMHSVLKNIKSATLYVFQKIVEGRICVISCCIHESLTARSASSKQRRHSVSRALHQCLIVEPNRKQAGGTVTSCGSITVVVRVMAALLVTGGLGTVRLSDWHSVAQSKTFHWC